MLPLLSLSTSSHQEVMLVRLLRHSRFLCVHQSKFGMFPLCMRNSSYLCKDRVGGPQNISENVTSQVEERGCGELSEEDIHRQNLQTKALSFLAMVNESALNSKQLEIHRAHVQALKAGDMFYIDPMTSYEVMTRLAHLHRGDCCGNACRHCPFGQKSAPEKMRRIYNSAFYE